LWCDRTHTSYPSFSIKGATASVRGRSSRL